MYKEITFGTLSTVKPYKDRRNASVTGTGISPDISFGIAKSENDEVTPKLRFKDDENKN